MLRFKINELNRTNNFFSKKINLKIEIFNENCSLIIQYNYNQNHRWIHFGLTWKNEGD